MRDFLARLPAESLKLENALLGSVQGELCVPLQPNSLPFFFLWAGCFLTFVTVTRAVTRPALSGGMDWWRMEWPFSRVLEWPFSRVRKYIFQRPKFPGKSWSFAQKERFLPNFRLRNFRIQQCNFIPPQPCHTPTRLPPSYHCSAYCFSRQSFGGEGVTRADLHHRYRYHCLYLFQKCLQWGRSNVVDLAESLKSRLLNQDFGNILSTFPRKNSKTQSSLNFL